MTSFYKNLKTMTKVEALRQAQLNLTLGAIDSDFLARSRIDSISKLDETSVAEPVSTSHPCFWAPFVLVGQGK